MIHTLILLNRIMNVKESVDNRVLLSFLVIIMWTCRPTNGWNNISNDQHFQGFVVGIIWVIALLFVAVNQTFWRICS